MQQIDQHQTLYEDLADHYDRKGEARQRDVFLTLAADAAQQAGRADQAERLRGRLMQVSPHNLLRPYPSFAEALQSQDIHDYIADLRRQYPPDQALTLMRTLRGSGYQPKPAPPIYRFQSEPAKNARTTLSAAAPPAAPAPAPAPSPYETFAPYTRQPESDGDSGAWIATILFGVGVLAAAAIALWTFGRPFFK